MNQTTVVKRRLTFWQLFELQPAECIIFNFVAKIVVRSYQSCMEMYLNEVLHCCILKFAVILGLLIKVCKPVVILIMILILNVKLAIPKVSWLILLVC